MPSSSPVFLLFFSEAKPVFFPSIDCIPRIMNYIKKPQTHFLAFRLVMTAHNQHESRKLLTIKLQNISDESLTVALRYITQPKNVPIFIAPSFYQRLQINSSKRGFDLLSNESIINLFLKLTN